MKPLFSTLVFAAPIVLATDPALNTMEVQVTFSGLTCPTSAAHIHCCEAMPGANLNVMVATSTPFFPGFPIGVTAGTYDHRSTCST